MQQNRSKRHQKTDVGQVHFLYFIGITLILSFNKYLCISHYFSWIPYNVLWRAFKSWPQGENIIYYYKNLLDVIPKWKLICCLPRKILLCCSVNIPSHLGVSTASWPGSNKGRISQQSYRAECTSLKVWTNWWQNDIQQGRRWLVYSKSGLRDKKDVKHKVNKKV